ncbi:SGNH/GDSL hydrolase family protein [Candidatus Sumerlaeota bacterium]|nr:SGNH/GDSL hydrolase family protein [Candidatus Sumerlaeota bacterium]
MILLILSSLPLGARGFTSIDIVGDSISDGANPQIPAIQDKGWVAMLYGDFEEEPAIQNLWPGIARHNHAVPGSKASEWADAAYPAMQQVLQEIPDLAVVYLGINDLYAYIQDADEVFSTSDQEAFRQDLSTIIDLLQALPATPEILVLNQYDLLDGVSESIPPGHPLYFLRHYSSGVQTMNAIVAEVAALKECHLLDIHPEWFHHAYGKDFGDAPLDPPYVHMDYYDVHPNTEGHRVIYRKVYAALRSIKESEANEGQLRINDWQFYE